MKRVLDLGADTGFGLFECQQQRFLPAVFHFLNRAAPGSGTAPSGRILLIFTQVFPHAEITRVAVYPFVIFTNQMPRMVTSATLADVATTLWVSPVTASTPI